MAETILLLSKALFACVGAAAGMRLAQMARAEGGVPLHGWVSALIFVGGIGLVLFGLGAPLAAASSGLSWTAMALGDALERVALLGLGVFVWRLFGGGLSWRLAPLALVWGAVLGDCASGVANGHWPDSPHGAPELWGQLAFALPFVWAAGETSVLWQRSVRQLALGLGDPIVSDRYRLWGSACATFAGICLLAALGALLVEGSAPHAAVQLARSACYLAVSAFVWIGLFPPEAYLRRVRARA